MPNVNDHPFNKYDMSPPPPFDQRKADFKNTDLYKKSSKEDQALVDEAKDDRELEQAINYLESKEHNPELAYMTPKKPPSDQEPPAVPQPKQ